MSEEQYVTPQEPTLADAVADLGEQPEAQVPDHADQDQQVQDLSVLQPEGQPVAPQFPHPENVQPDTTPAFVEPQQPEQQPAPDTISPPVPDAANPAPPPEGTDAQDEDPHTVDAPDDFIDTVNQDGDNGGEDVTTEPEDGDPIDKVGAVVVDTDVDPA